MAILGTPFKDDDSTNPSYTIDDFKFWMPLFKNYMSTDEGKVMFDNLYDIANQKILYSIFGADWRWAMSLCIAHYAVLIGRQQQEVAPDNLADIASTSKQSGVMSSASIGGFNKSWDLDHSMSDKDDAVWWNSTEWGKQLYNLYMSKPIFSMFVVTNGNIPGSGNL